MAATLEQTLIKLEKLVADLLLMATDEQALAQEYVLLEPMLQEAIAGATALAIKHDVALRFAYEPHANSDEDMWVRGDGTLLERAFGNLIENGIRYNHPGGRVTVTLSHEGRYASAAVEDTGVGIPPEHTAAIFDRFYRVARTRSQHSGGAGLGLSIVAHVVRLHGGQVHVESVEGNGSRFVVKLPLVTLPPN